MMATGLVQFLTLCVLMDTVNCISYIPWNTHDSVWKDSKYLCKTENEENRADQNWLKVTQMVHESFVSLHINKEKSGHMEKKFKEDFCKLPSILKIVSLFLKILCPFGILSNLILILNYMRDATTRTITFVPIILVSIVNIQGIFCIIWRIYGDAHTERSSSEFHRAMYLVAESISALATGYHIAFLVGMKYVFRAYPTYCRVLLTRRITVIMGLTIWIYSLAFSMIVNDLSFFVPSANRISALISFQCLNTGPAVLILLFMKWSNDTKDQPVEDTSLFLGDSDTAYDPEMLSLDIVSSINRISKFYLICWTIEYIPFIVFLAHSPLQVLENIFAFVVMEYITCSVWAVFLCIAPIVYYYNTRQAHVLLGRMGFKET